MKILANITTPMPLNLRDDWETCFSFVDSPTKKTITVFIPGKNAVPKVLGRPGRPAVVANPKAKPPVVGRDAVEAIAEIPVIPACDPMTFVLWAGDAYDTAAAEGSVLSIWRPDIAVAAAAELAKMATS